MNRPWKGLRSIWRLFYRTGAGRVVSRDALSAIDRPGEAAKNCEVSLKNRHNSSQILTAPLFQESAARTTACGSFIASRRRSSRTRARLSRALLRVFAFTRIPSLSLIRQQTWFHLFRVARHPPARAGRVLLRTRADLSIKEIGSSRLQLDERVRSIPQARACGRSPSAWRTVPEIGRSTQPVIANDPSLSSPPGSNVNVLDRSSTLDRAHHNALDATLDSRPSFPHEYAFLAARGSTRRRGARRRPGAVLRQVDRHRRGGARRWRRTSADGALVLSLQNGVENAATIARARAPAGRAGGRLRRHGDARARPRHAPRPRRSRHRRRSTPPAAPTPRCARAPAGAGRRCSRPRRCRCASRPTSWPSCGRS